MRPFCVFFLCADSVFSAPFRPSAYFGRLRIESFASISLASMSLASVMYRAGGIKIRERRVSPLPWSVWISMYTKKIKSADWRESALSIPLCPLKQSAPKSGDAVDDFSGCFESFSGGAFSALAARRNNHTKSRAGNHTNGHSFYKSCAFVHIRPQSAAQAALILARRLMRAHSFSVCAGVGRNALKPFRQNCACLRSPSICLQKSVYSYIILPKFLKLFRNEERSRINTVAFFILSLPL